MTGACDCGHGWHYHDFNGCGYKSGHDIYCSCQVKNPESIEVRRLELVGRCLAHKHYSLKKEPKIACSECWRNWFALQGQ